MDQCGVYYALYDIDANTITYNSKMQQDFGVPAVAQLSLIHIFSHQLRILKQNKLVKSRREGKSIFYSLADGHVSTIIAQGRDHIEEDA